MPIVAMLPPEPPSTFEGPKVPYPATEQPAEDSPLYKTDEFRMYCFKVLPCSKRYVHDWTVCPFAHPGEKAKRRDPRVFTYTGVACPDMKKCQRGDACPYAHNVFEYWMHPSRYRTQLCNDGIGCKRKVCFFAHTLDELRVSNVKLLPSDIAAGADAGFDLDPFRPAKSEPSRNAAKPAGASVPNAASCGNEALVEALRTQQQQQARKAAATLQRTASRGLAAELQQMQMLQQLQTVLASTQGLGALSQQVPQQYSVDNLVGAMMSQMRLGGGGAAAAGPQHALPMGSGATPGLLDAIVQQTVQQVLANNAAQQAAATLLLLQQQQQQQAAAAAAAMAQQQQQSQQAAHAQALLEHLLQQQQQQSHERNAAAHGLPDQHELHAALAMLHQQQHHHHQQQHQFPPMGPLPPYVGAQSQGPPASAPMPIGRPAPSSLEEFAPATASFGMSPSVQQQHPLPHSLEGPGAPSGHVGSLPASLRSSGTGMTAGSSLGMQSPGTLALAPARSAPLPSDVVVPSAAVTPSSPRSQTEPPPSNGSPPADASLSSTMSGHTAASALSAAATSSSYFSHEVSRSSFESYRSSELELSLHLAAGQHPGLCRDSDGAAAAAHFDMLKPTLRQPQGAFMPDGLLSRSPCSPGIGPIAEEPALVQEARRRQLLMAAAAQTQAANNGSAGAMTMCGAPGMHGGPGFHDLLADQAAMGAFAQPGFGM
ncbi:hypothetical protein Agub_g2194 [Astrephomene gubernaculifera]|uniref:C3H1-type domain-containing protein n=1 Tax=Astrephomene gubernaculifera TaxID=47775 RepID=A0AAD3DGQ9_9CHLO|nr:hypothetical protein Agub_g2194 [Astrephomene gubernaculifera]